MRTSKIVKVLVAGLFLLATPSVSAQGLGGLLNKAKKAAEKVDKVLNSKDGNAKEGTADTQLEVSSMLSANGISIANPLADVLTVDPVGLVGVPTSENWGTAYLVLKVKNLLPDVSSVLFGSSTNPRDKMIASDGNGKMLQVDASGGYRYDTPVDITVTLDLSENGLHFLNVPRSCEMMEMVRINVVMNGSNRGNITLKNVPISWMDSQEEE